MGIKFEGWSWEEDLWFDFWRIFIECIVGDWEKCFWFVFSIEGILDVVIILWLVINLECLDDVYKL